MKKKFDCVEMMHEAALRIYERTKDMTVEEEAAYWRKLGAAPRRRPSSRAPRRIVSASTGLRASGSSRP